MNKTLSPTGRTAGFATRFGLRAALAAGLAICNATLLTAQNAWDAILNIDPYPSPYYSDWDNNPNIASLTVINPGAAKQVRIHFNVTNRANKIVLSGSSDPQSIGARATAVFDNPYDVAGSTHHDEEEERIAARTGRLREGEYTACAVVADLTGFSLAESCAPFKIVYPDPPLLLTPENRDVITQTDPLFQWTPVQVPVDFQLSYVLRVVEILNGQTPQEALRSNIPHFQSLDGQFPSMRYPIDARPFEVGKQYAWTVQVLDQNGYAASGNDGRSEIWTFRYGDSPAESSASTVTLTLLNDGSDPSQDVGFSAICEQWYSAPNTISFPVTGASFPAVLTAPQAALYRDSTSAGRTWAVIGTALKQRILLAGDCGISGSRTVPRWVGLRSAGDTQELENLLAGDEPPTDEAVFKLKFGLVALSLFEQSIGGDAALPAVNAFLENYEIDVKPGVNVYGVLDARQFPKIWDFLSYFYSDNEHEVTLQGFVGVNSTYAARVGVFGTIGIEGARTREFLTLSAMLPAKNFNNSVITSIQPGFEITYGDSSASGYGFDRGRGRDLVVKPLKIEVITDTITWTGTWEIDVSMDTARWFLGPPTGERKHTLRLTTDHEWQPGPLENSAVALGHLQLYLDINDHFIEGLRKGQPGQIGWDLNLRGAVIWQNEEVATAVVTVGRKGDPKTFWEDETKKAQSKRKEEKRKVDLWADAKENALIRGDTASAREFHERYQKALPEYEKAQKAVYADSLTALDYAKYYKQGERAATHDDDRFRTQTFWQVSLQFGNMSLPNLFDLIKNVAAARRERSP